MKTKLLLAAIAAVMLAQQAIAGCVPYWTATKTSRALPYEREIEAGDFNGDGLTDFASAAVTSIHVSLTTADGVGAPKVLYQSDYFPDFLRVADFNDDGKDDILATDVAKNILVALPGNGDGTFRPAVVTPTGISASRFIEGDFTNDGHLDLTFVSHSASMLVVRAGDGTGAFATVAAATPLPTLIGGMQAADFDDDGLLDLASANGGVDRIDVRFGNGDGTFDEPVALPAGDYPVDFAVADLDGDGDADIATADWDSNTTSILINQGGRLFAPAVSYDVTSPSAYTYDNPNDIVAHDVTQDGVADIVLTLVNGRTVVTLAGKGDGTFEAPRFVRVFAPDGSSNTFLPQRVGIGHFDKDGRADLFVVDTHYPYIGLYPNNCGDLTLSLAAKARVITAGAEATFSATTYPPPAGYPARTGTIRLMEGTTELASGTISVNGGVTFTVSGLSLGEHTVHAIYSGDENYHGTTSTTVIQKVTDVVTNITLKSSVANPRYGQYVNLEAEVSTSDGGKPSGELRLSKDGIDASNPTRPGPTGIWQITTATGSQTYRVRYDGDALFPAANSNELKLTVAKAAVTMTEPDWSPRLSRQGQTSITIAVAPEFSGAPTGTFVLYEGETVLATTQYEFSSVTLTPALAVGTHMLRLVYQGDENFQQTTLEFRHDVLPDSFTVIGNGGPQVTIHWLSQGDVWYYRVQRLVNGAWQQVATLSRYDTLSYAQPNPQAGTVYVFRVIADTYSNVPITSNVVFVMAGSFLDDPLASGATVKAAHFQQLLTATNTLRAAAGRPLLQLGFAPGQRVTAAEIGALRAAIDDARAVAGVAPFAWTDPQIGPGTIIRAVHLQQLRNAFR